MPIFSNLTQPNIKDKSTLSADGFPFTPLARQEEERAKRTTDISGRRFAELLRRPKWIVLENVAGLFTILELESLSKMEIQEVDFFVRTNSKKQTKQSSTSKEESLEQLFRKFNQQDIYFRNLKMAHQSFCVFQLVPWTPTTAGTGSGLLPAPNTVQISRLLINSQTLEVTENTTKYGASRQPSITDGVIIMPAEAGLIPSIKAIKGDKITC